MKKPVVTIYLILIIFFVFPFKGLTWYKETHKLITEYAVRNSLLGNVELCKKLNLDKGLLQEWLKLSTWLSKKRTILKWIQYGAVCEDNGVPQISARSDNHFHNPHEEDWQNAGLDDWDRFVDINWHGTGKQMKKKAMKTDRITLPGYLKDLAIRFILSKIWLCQNMCVMMVILLDACIQ
jgi:hypothetical protein